MVEEKNKIHCKICGYVPTGLVYVEKCIYCNKRLYFPSHKLTRKV